jgi:lysozyme family protein
MADFKQAHSIVMNNEGGYANDPSDRGGETYKGISRNNFPNWKGWKLIDLHKLHVGFPQNLEADQGCKRWF